MTECNRKNRLLGKSIRKIRMRRNMTQRELANAIDGISEPALRSYELGERCPKQNTLERIAKALDVAPACFDAYGIEHYHELMHVLFLLEDRFGIEPCGKHPIYRRRGAMAMADCESEKTIHYEEDGWSVTLTRYVSMELGETVASWVEFPNGWYLHSDDADAEFTQDGAKTYLQRLKSVWMESPFWDGVRRAMEEKPQ